MLSQDNVIISLSDVEIDFNRYRALKNVNLDVYKNDFIAITGPNGGGKTTLLKVILKLIKPSRGNVKYFSEGRVVKNLHIGYLPQKTDIDTHFPITVEEVVKSGLLKGFFSNLNDDKNRRLFENTVEFTGIGEYLDKPIYSLSGGQLQRTLLGRALISEPDVVVLDEPLSYVDKEFERGIYSMMKEISERATIILVSHEMSVISGMANRHIIVDNGSLHQCEAHQHYIPTDCCDCL